MKVITKRLSIRILSILLLGVLSLGGLFLHNGVKATAAETEKISTTDLLSTNATVELGGEGLQVSSDSAYQSEIKGIFKGDTTLNFRFPEGTGEKPDTYYGDFKFRVSDIENESNYFDVIYGIATTSGGSVYTVIYLEYTPQGGTKQTRSSHHQKHEFYQKVDTTQPYSAGYPCFLSYCSGNGRTPLDMAQLHLVWTDDVLSVQAKKLNGTYTLAEFDGTETFKNVTGNLEATTFGLPKIDGFKDGYKISFSSSFDVEGVEDHATDVCIKEIISNGTSYALTEANLTVPSFYTDYVAWAQSNPTEELDLADLLKETTGTATANSGLRVSSDSAYAGTFKGVFIGDVAFDFTFPETYTDNDSDGKPDAYYGNFRFRIADATDDSKFFDLVYEPIFIDGKYYTALYLEYTLEDGTKQIRTCHFQRDEFYNKKITGTQSTLYAPAFLQYADGDKSHDDRLLGQISLVWTDDVLSVMARSKNDTMRTLAEFDGTKTFNNVTKNLEATTFGLPKINFENGYTISFSSSFTADGVEDHATDVCFKQIAGTDLSAGGTVKVAYKFETTFENATVSGLNVYIPQNEEIGEIKGLYTHAYGNGWYEKSKDIAITQTVDVSTVGEKTLTITDDSWEDTPLGVINRTYKVHVETPYTLTIDFGDGATIKEMIHSEHTTDRIVVPESAERLFWVFDKWLIGNQEWSGDVSELSGKDVTLTARWLDMEAPTIWLNGVNDVTYLQKGATIAVGKADVTAGDAAQNESIVVTWAVKKPNETEFTALTDDTLTLSVVGSYSIQYTVTDPAGYTATCERTLVVRERNIPTFTVEEGFTTETYPMLNVVFANVTAKNADGEELDTIVTVVRDGVLIENDGMSFLPTVMGEYRVTFFAADKAPYESLQSIYSYTVVVYKDDVAPEIGDEFTDMTVKKNEQVTIPTVTATDNVSGSVPVEVSVYYGTQKIQLTNGKFTADQEGTYRVVLVAEDEAGNRAEKTVYVTVEMGTNGGNGGGCSGCGASGDLGLPMGLLMIAGSFVFGKNIMMKKMKRKENI